MKNTKTKKPEELLVFEIDRALQLLVDTCEATSKNIGGDFITIDILKTYKMTLVEKYKEGLKSNPNFK